MRAFDDVRVAHCEGNDKPTIQGDFLISFEFKELASIADSAKTGTIPAAKLFVGEVRATDPDNDAISFSLDRDDIPLFEVVNKDPRVVGAKESKTTGYILIKDTLLWEVYKQYLDYDQIKDQEFSYDFRITANDGKGGLNRKRVFVHFTDINDNTPRFCNRTVTPEPGKYCQLVTGSTTKSIAYVPENTMKDVLVTDIYVEDLDELDSGRGDMSFEIVSGNSEKRFALANPPNLKYSVIDTKKVGGRHRRQLVLIDKLDYDNGGTREYTIGVKAIDCPNVGVCSDSRHSIQKYVIKVSDFNDNAPIFKQDVYQVTVKENQKSTADGVAASKALINMTIVATDADSGVNGDVLEYAVYDSNQRSVSDLVGVLADGQLYLKKHINYEGEELKSDKKLTLSVRASDKGSPKKETFSDLVITVSDFNDNAPVWSSSKQVEDVSIKEELQAGTPVITVDATDADLTSTHRSAVRYYISHKNGTATSDLDFQFVDAASGKLTTRRPLEADGGFGGKVVLTIFVMAKDMGDLVGEPGTSRQFVALVAI